MILRILGRHPIFIYSLLCAGFLSAAQLSQVDLEFEELKHELQMLESKLGDIGKEAMTFEDVDIKSLLEGVMQKVPHPSTALSQCYQKVCQGECLTINEVMDIMPELIDCAKETTRSVFEEEERAPRPDAPAVTAGNAIVGKNNCDLTQVLGLLSAIKKQIQNLEKVICQKFQETWTILDNLLVSVTVDFSDVFTVLEEIDNDIIDTRTILCDKFLQTWTILACLQDIGISEPLTISEPGVYCLLNDIVGTITIASSDVTLNLNHHSIGGADNAIVVTAGSNDVFIKNGAIDNFTSNGILASTVQNLAIHNVVFNTGPIGINISDSICIIIKECIFQGLTSSAINISASNTVIMEFIKAHNNSIQGGTLNVINLSAVDNVTINEYICTLNDAGTFRGINAVNCDDLFLNNTLVSSSTATSVFEGITFNPVSSAKLKNCHVVDCTALINTLLGFGIGLNGSSDITLKHCSVSNITSLGGGALSGISTNQSFNLRFIDCSASNIVGDNSVAGFDNVSSQDLLYDHCVSTSNSGISAGESYGFFANQGVKVIYTECIGNDNISTNTGNGFVIINSDNSCILQSIAKQNNGDNTGRGIGVLDSRECTIDLNLTTSNFGGVSSIGIHVANTGGGGVLNNTVINNKSAAHINNYLISPGAIATIVYIRDPLFISAPPTGIDNFDIR